MEEKLYCTYCGAANEPGARFCERCGHELEALVMPADEPAAQSAAQAPGTGETDDLLSALMKEPVVGIPEEPAPAASAGASGTEEERQRELYIEESLRYIENEKREREEQRVAAMRRQQEEELYAPFEGMPAGGYAGGAYSGYAGGGYGDSANTVKSKPQEAPRKKSKVWIPVLLIVLLLLAAGVFAGWKLLFNRTTVNLTHNITAKDLTLDGYDGEAFVFYDEEALRDRADYPRGNEKAEEFMQTVSYFAEPSMGLSNGDTVTIRAIYSEETAKSLQIDVKGVEKELKVEGLEEAPAAWDPLGLFTGGDKKTGDDKETDKTGITGETLIPGIDTKYYTDADVTGKSQEDIQAMINEMYARHGYRFKDETLLQQYEATDWYKGTETDMGKVESTFNDCEKKNLQFLTEKRQ